MYVLFTSFTIISIKRIFKETNIFSWKNLCFFKLIGLTHLWFLDRFVVLLSPLMYCVFFCLLRRWDFLALTSCTMTLIYLHWGVPVVLTTVVLSWKYVSSAPPSQQCHYTVNNQRWITMVLLTGRPAHQHLTITINQPANNNLTKLFIKLRLVIKEENKHPGNVYSVQHGWGPFIVVCYPCYIILPLLSAYVQNQY